MFMLALGHSWSERGGISLAYGFDLIKPKKSFLEFNLIPLNQSQPQSQISELNSI